MLDKGGEWTTGLSNDELMGDLDNTNVNDIVSFT